MKYYIFRNSTIEILFENLNVSFSEYGNILSIDLNADIFVWFYTVPLNMERKFLILAIESYFNSIQLVQKLIPDTKTFLIFTLQDPFRAKPYIADFSVDRAMNYFNFQIIDFASKYNNIKIIDFTDFTKDYSQEHLIDWKYYFLSRMPFNPRLSNPFQEWFSRQIEAINMKRKKCLILDLDNTLWGGVLGEDGIENVKISGDYPGNAFTLFQQKLLDLSRTGVILAICSKNNEDDVLELWEKNPFMILKKDNFSSYRINWSNKADNICEISKELNIGLDSIVFIDDSPTERELVKQLLPMIEVPCFPAHPYLLPVFAEKLQREYFYVYKVTEEDKTKTDQYQNNSLRTSFQKSFANFTDFLRSLEISLTIQKGNYLNIPRIAQMTQKTNQFNLTTKRYLDVDIQKFISRNDYVFCMSVKDKFGDDGITGAIILTMGKGNSVTIDSLLLSCRILGKGVERAFVVKVLSLIRKDGINIVYAHYIPTKKNEQVKYFYEKIGFHLINEIDGIKTYQFEFKDEDLTIEQFYNIQII